MTHVAHALVESNVILWDTPLTIRFPVRGAVAPNA